MKTFPAIAAFVAATLSAGAIASAADDPHLVLRHVTWKSSTGACRLDLSIATVAGVPADVKARIDEMLAQNVANGAPDSLLSPAAREAQCLSETADHDKYASSGSDKFQAFQNVDWTTGLAHGRWLSVRFHAERYEGQAHPNDFYDATTFDLAHGGYPVPKSGFYLAKQRATLNTILVAASIPYVKKINPTYAFDSGEMQLMHLDIEQATVDATAILVTKNGIEVTGLGGDEASRNEIVPVAFSRLSGVGTPGGPLDATTR